MGEFSNSIKIDHNKIMYFIESVKNMNYQIPTFQREVVWDKVSVKKLWDSIYKFYPIGSILVWKTDMKLQNHKSVGGHKISDDTERKEYQYILDGQQRTTSLLTSLFGGEIENKPDFNPKLYVDLTVINQSDTDDETYKKRFLFWDEIDDGEGRSTQNVQRKKKYDEGLIVELRSIAENFDNLLDKIVEEKGYKSEESKQLRAFKYVLDNYELSFIELAGIKVGEVCQIFERINQAGKQLDIFDIVVAKTFVPKTENDKGFYLRELIDEFRSKTESHFMNISYFDYLQILSVLISEYVPNSGVQNITPVYLNNIKTNHIQAVWDDGQKAILCTFKFFENYLHLQPYLIPYRYLYMTITAYFFRNPNPDYDFLIKYFWYYSFHAYDLLSNTTHLHNHVRNLIETKNGNEYPFETFVFDRQKLRNSKYSATGRFCSAILALYTSKEPHDWKEKEMKVQVSNYFATTDKPQLHHVFPTNSSFVHDHPNENQNSLMNIAFITQETNLKITNRNPNEYLPEFVDEKFSGIMSEHFLPQEFFYWSGENKLPDDAITIFIEKRIELIEKFLREILKGVDFQVIDTKA